MNEDRTQPEVDSTVRAGARRRASHALVANYIHELSERHGGGGGTARERGSRTGDRENARDVD
jgi:hypothetical protein